MREQFKGVKKDGTLTDGSLVLNASSKEERKHVLKEYKFLSNSVQLIKVYDEEKGECYEEVIL